MLIPKIINVFLAIMFGIFAFSIIFFLLDNLPKRQVAIKFKIEKENLQAISLCNIFLNSEIRKNIIELSDGINKDSNIEIIRSKVKSLGLEAFEIVIDKYFIREGKIKLNEIYNCQLFYDEKRINIIIKL
ncbi:MAG: hypothetical protein QW197_01910 [Candidatus Aenigmatarchaeota archaeon]